MQSPSPPVLGRLTFPVTGTTEQLQALPTDTAGSTWTSLTILQASQRERKIQKSQSQVFLSPLPNAAIRQVSGEQWKRRKTKEAGSVPPKAPALGVRVKNPLLYGNKGAENDYLTEQLFQHQQCLRTSNCPRNPVCWHFHLLHSLLLQGFKISNVWIMSNSDVNISLISRQLLTIADVEAMHHMALCCFWRCDKTMATFPVDIIFRKLW